MLRKTIAIACLLLSISSAWADPPDAAVSASPTAPYLLAGAPTFDLTVVEFREKYNRDNPKLPIGEFRAIAAAEDDTPLLTRAASKLNENLYASTALEKGKGSRFYQQQVGAIRYVVSDNGDKGVTFAVEPVKLTLSEP